jgi:hypothetical protein
MNRRQMLTRCANGFGAAAMGALFGCQSTRSAFTGGIGQPHHAAKAKSVIFLYMDGGPSQVDTFDPKPLLTQHHGADPREIIGKLDATQFADVGKVHGSPWEFERCGESGIWISELFPHLKGVADELCVLNGMIAKFPEHTAANYFLHSGHGLQGRPSIGAWATYGLGSDNEDLPGFVVLNGGLIPPGGLDCFGSGFLPATHQASVLRPRGAPLANIEPSRAEHQTELLAALRDLDGEHVRSLEASGAEIESAIENYELAFRMQSSVPELAAIDGETEETRAMYGCDSEYGPTATYARECLLARRLVERGVRFIELTCPSVSGDRWDQHNDLKAGHENNARAVDQPIAALLKDLKQRGLLDSTLIIWGGEFGRTPFAQGSNGRDHNPQGFSMWMAGGGVKGGQALGRTDEFGYRAVEGKTEIHDLHATMLHLMGIDHERLTYRFGGRDLRLTDVYGHVITDALL